MFFLIIELLSVEKKAVLLSLGPNYFCASMMENFSIIFLQLGSVAEFREPLRSKQLLLLSVKIIRR